MVFTFSGGTPAAPPQEVDIDELAAPAELPSELSVAGPGQQPGTVRLPDGGTAKLVRREVTRNGTLPIPRGLEEASWWGAKLGAPKGASLLSGHVNWGGTKGPFDQLWRIRAGQNVTVLDARGLPWIYRVDEIVTLHKDELPKHAPQLFGQDGPPRLVLVTCGGDYVGGTDGYRDNRVVTASLVSGS
ncbi:class F sortase [Amycolatopsis nigrescens]|uniref:class F sortase n=1 Tax=Amycolatopsis nigrescens TaxID=381445 RepID=UPI000A017FFC|nr:class F sortase [Amycolatopsis nigrescens]